MEPSAGDGVFFDLLPNGRRIGLDLAPRRSSVEEMNFFDFQPETLANEDVAVIGNPPFGKRGSLAVDFMLKAAEFSVFIGFILPMCFTKYRTQSRIPASWHLVASDALPPDSFILPDGKPYKVNSVFQIWTCKDVGLPDLRAAKPEISHADFLLYQYNNTRAAEKYFEEDYDFAVVCQGWKDIGRKETRVTRKDWNKQWMLVKCVKQSAMRVFDRIDFSGLAKKAYTTVPGFRKHELVAAYKEMSCA